MTDLKQEIKRLQKLSCISLSPEQEQKFWTQLTDIISFLGKLPDTKMNDEWWIMNDKGKLTLRTIPGTQENPDGERILKNVKHGIVHNSVVIKSVLS